MKLKQIICVLFLFSLMFLSPAYSYAQFEKGHKIIGGYFGFSYIDNSAGEHYYRNGNFRISPTIGYFTSAKSMWGFSPTVSLSHNKASYQLEPGNQWGLGTSVFYRRFFKATEQFHFFLEPSLGYQGTINSEHKNERLEVRLSPGLAYLASERLWLEATFGGINYTHERYGPQDNLTSWHYLFAGVSSYTSLGLFYILK